jgi:hypothetical protein
MIRSALNLVVVAMLAFFCAPSRVAHARDGEWIEVIETYEIPFDPDWRESALTADIELSVDRRADYAARLEQAGTNERAKKAVKAARRKENDSFGSSADAARKMFVVRAWNGIKRVPIVLILGEKQRASFARCQPSQLLQVSVGKSNVPDHLQAKGRTTIVAVIGGPRVPTDFLHANEGMPALRDVSFGEVDAAAFNVGTVVCNAQKDPKAGSGIILVTFTLPEKIPFELASPWYCKFKLMELDKDGAPAKEVQFEGAQIAVAVTGRVAKARIEVKNPKPYGYSPKATQWFGVAPNTALKATKKPQQPTQTVPSTPIGPGAEPIEPETSEPQPKEAPRSP